MQRADITQFVLDHFSNNRAQLIPVLGEFDWETSEANKVFQAINEQISRPFSGSNYFYEDKRLKFQQGLYDPEEDIVGDISDQYEFNLHPEAKHSSEAYDDEWRKHHPTVHFCELWVSWFFPVYYLETSYETLSEAGKFLQCGPLTSLNEFETLQVQKIEEILAQHHFSPLPLEYLQQEYPGLKTDCTDKPKLSLFECLFSDFSYYKDQHIKKNNTKLVDPYEKKVSIGLHSILDDDGSLIQQERTLYYNAFGYVTIRSNAVPEVTEVICRGYIDGIEGHRKVIKFDKKNAEVSLPETAETPSPFPMTSERLSLRPLQLTDAEALFAYRSDAVTNQYQGSVAQHKDEMVELIERKSARTWNTPDTWFQVGITLSESGGLIGDVGVHFCDAESGEVEFGITLNKEFHGKGYATEALRRLTDYLFIDLQKRRITASIDPRNTASLHLMERLGMRKEAHFKESYLFNDEWVDDVQYGLLSKEWKTR